MGLIQAVKQITKQHGKRVAGSDSSGIALFMVLSAISVLAILVTEFTYVAQINQTIAYGALDQAKAHYLAKSAFKLSLLRLKAYQQVKSAISNMGGGAEGAVPKAMINKIWSFPITYPFPTNIPGLSRSDKDAIEKFQKESSLDGKFSINIESESSKFNLNGIIAGYSTPAPTPSASPSPTGTLPPNNQNPSNPNPSTSFNVDVARDSLSTFLGTLLTQKFEADADFAAQYRDLRLEDLVDNIIAWADRTYDRRTSNSRDKVPMKKAPFYSLSELHYLATVDDEVFNLLAPTLTVSPTAGINVNTATETTLKALMPGITPEELKEFFKYRDSEETDNSFKNAEDFFTYLSKNVAIFQNPQTLSKFKEDLTKRKISILTEKTLFRITVQAQVNSATRTIQAWVTLLPLSGGGSGTTPGTPPGTPPPIVGPGPSGTPRADSGIRITFMRIY